MAYPTAEAPLPPSRDIGIHIYRERDAATDIGINISRVREEESLRDTLILSSVHGQIDEDI